VEDCMAKRPASCTSERWATAQVYEIRFWKKVAGTDLYVEQVKWPWYQSKAIRLAQLLREHCSDGLRPLEGQIVELGSGPVGIAPLLTAAPVWLIDPLARDYVKLSAFTRFRPSNASYFAACGEAIPVGSGVASLLIAENCLDHVRDVGAVVSEMRRVLKPGGILFLTVSCRSRLGWIVHRLLARWGLDAGHPHTMLKQDVVALLKANGFDERWHESESLLRVWWNDLVREGIRGKAKAILGVSEALLSCMFERTADDRMPNAVTASSHSTARPGGQREGWA
jgi:SAM-dependent methyltransferase